LHPRPLPCPAVSGKRDHLELMREAMELEAQAQRALLAGDDAGGRAGMRAAAERWAASWDAAPPRAFGRLVGMVKAAVVAGEPDDAARRAREEIGDEADSPTSWYALAIAALVEDDDGAARRAADEMRAGGEAFERAAGALAALADRDADRYRAAVEGIVEDFEARDRHLTGVAIADTALMLERLAERRGIAARPPSALLPPAR
jgi:hypothetical protein